KFNPLSSILWFSQKVSDDKAAAASPVPVYPNVNFQVLNVDHVFLRQDSREQLGNSSLKPQTQTFLITGPGGGLLQPVVNASYGPLTVDAPIPPDLLLSGRKILPVILTRQVRSSSPVVKILFHMPTDDTGRKTDEAKVKDGAHCVTAYAFWETREIRGACLVSPGGFCVAQLKLEPTWFSSASRSGSSSRETERSEGTKVIQGNVVEVYFQSRRDQSGQCAPQDSLQRVGVGRRRDSGGSGTPMRRIGSVSLLRAPPGNPTFLRLRLGGAVVIQTSSKPLKTTDCLYITILCMLLYITLYITLPCGNVRLFSENRGLLEVLQLDFVPKDVSDQVESQSISWPYTTNPDLCVCVCVCLCTQTTDILNTAVLTGKTVSVQVKTLAVEANGSVTDVTNYTSCRSTQEDVLKLSERCDSVYVNGKETRGRLGVLLNFTYGFLSAQLEMSVWTPRVPLLIDVADPELSQIKGWRVPVTTGNRSEEEEEMRKGRGCMLQYQHSTLRVLTPFVAQPGADVLPDPLTGEEPVEYFLGSDWQVRTLQSCNLVMDLGFERGCALLQVLSPLTASVLAERSVRVVDDKVSVTELGVQLVSGLSLSLQVSPGSNRATVATGTPRETITQLKQEAVISCWVQFSDGAVVPLELFDRSIYSLTVSTPDEGVATVRRTPQSTFVVAQGESDGQGALVRVELRICEECQKSKRKSKLAVGSGLLKINLATAKERDTAMSAATTVAIESKGEGQKRTFGNMLDNNNSPPNKEIAKAEITPKKEPPKSKTPKVIESDLIRTFKALSDLEIGMYALVGVSCVAIFAFLLNCVSYNLCFRNQKTPIQPGAPPQVSTLKREPHRPLEPRHSIDSMGHRGLETPLPTVSAPAVPERTATLGRSRTSSQQQFQTKAIDPLANRSATLLARPHRSEPLHSPTSKRNQVQFTTFTTLDIKHLAALKKNGVDLNWASQQKQQQQQQQLPSEPQTPLP
uniref:Uncharacterized protein n=1 Tax=Salarias fasciatus TaxID=181472 RepID=A0A672HPW3_SALFA